MHDNVRPLTELADRLQQQRRRRSTLLVGIDGRGGSGKSTLARSFIALLPSASVVEFDDFYRLSTDRRHRVDDAREFGGNFDWRRVRDQVLAPLSDNQPANYQRYDWPSDRLAEWHTIQPGGIVIIEGNYSTRRTLRDFYDFTIWIEAPHGPDSNEDSHAATTPSTAGSTNGCPRSNATSTQRTRSDRST